MSNLWVFASEWGEYEDPNFRQAPRPPDITKRRDPLRPTRGKPYTPERSCDCPGTWVPPDDPTRPHTQEVTHKMVEHNLPVDYSARMSKGTHCNECGGSDDDFPPSVALEGGIHFQPMVHENGMVHMRAMHQSTYTDHHPYSPGDGNTHYAPYPAVRDCTVHESDGIGYASDPDIAHKIEDYTKDPEVHAQLRAHLSQCPYFDRMLREHAGEPPQIPRSHPSRDPYRDPDWQSKMHPDWEKYA